MKEDSYEKNIYWGLRYMIFKNWKDYFFEKLGFRIMK